MTAKKMGLALAACAAMMATATADVVAASVAADTLEEWVDRFNADDDEVYTNAIPNSAAKAFLAANVPRFDCPDAEIERAYFFRWWTYRKHIKSTPDGYVITEFLPPVGWAGKHNTISCATGHHVMEGRWLRDGRYVDEYVRFMLTQGRVAEKGAYVFYPAAVLLERRKVTGDKAFVAGLLPDLVRVHDAWRRGWDAPLWPQRTPMHIGRTPSGLYLMIDNYEGMEYSIGGSGYRPYLNAAMYAEAKALALFMEEKGDASAAAAYEKEAAELADGIRTRLWNPERSFFTVVTTNGEHKAVRELTGYTPWLFGVPVPRSCEVAFRHLLDQRGFLAPYGLTVPEQCDPAFRLSYDGHSCLWDGPVWPYATSLALTALVNRLHESHDLDGVTPADFAMLLHQYAAAQKRVLPDGRSVSWIDENQHPYSGDWIARSVNLARNRGQVKMRERGKDYNHSTFCDLVITGLAGLVPSDGDEFAVDPLVPPTWRRFSLENVRYHGHDITVRWDADGTAYGKGAGLSVFVDGRLTAHSAEICRLKVSLP